jgi:hypothetical protein
MSIVQPLTGHTSQDTAHVTLDYPYGFKLRCERRCWLERDPAGRKGYRFCTQTSNPKKPGTWNAPKKSTYTMLAVMGLDEENHVTWTGVSMYQFEDTQDFVDKYGHAFDANQAMDSAAMLHAYKRHQARKAAVTHVIETGTRPSLEGTGLVDVTDQVMASLRRNNL